MRQKSRRTPQPAVSHENPMTFDQKIQIINSIGVWFAAIATFLAVILSLHLAKRSEKIKLKVYVGMRVIFDGDGSPQRNYVGITVTNIADRIVTINSVGWTVGKKKKKKHCIQPFRSNESSQCPLILSYGESGTFLIPLDIESSWINSFSNDFVEDCSENNLKTLRLQVHTSVGKTIEIVPEKNLLEELIKANI